MKAQESIISRNSMRSSKVCKPRYQFNIKKFPKVENKIPDNIAELNTPMLAADHRVIKQIGPIGGVGMTPMLQARPADKDKQLFDPLGKKNPLNPVKEEKDDPEEKKKMTTKTATVKNALKGL